MSNLEELKKKYEELGKEIERLDKQKNNKRWRADTKEQYWCVDETGATTWEVEKYYDSDNYYYKTRNYFKTEEEAQRHLDNINTYYELMDLAEELNAGKKIDWDNTNQLKYRIKFDYTTQSLISESSLFIIELTQIYCLDEDFLEIALERIGEERLENLFKGE